MKPQILKKIDYKGCPVYIRKMGTMFEYLVIFKDELYSNYLIISPGLTRIWSGVYTKKQLENCVSLTMKGAEVTIEALIKKHRKYRKK